MEKKFYKYARKSLNASWANIFADAEEKKDLYKLTNDEVLDLIKMCEIPGSVPLKEVVQLINTYYKDYEHEVFHDDLGKQLVVLDANELITGERTKDIRILTKTEVYSLAKRLERAALRYIVLGAYEGIGSYGNYPKQDLIEARADKIDVVNKTIELPSGHIFTYSDELIEAAVDSAREDTFTDSRGRVFTMMNTGYILRVVDSTKSNGAMSYPSLQRYYYLIKSMTGNSCIGWQRLAMSGFYNALNERLGGRQYNAKDKDNIQDILERYNKQTITDAALKNMRYYRKVVK